MSMFANTQTHAHAYEVALFGEFFARDLKAILNRLTLHTESAAPMHTREILFEQLGVQSQVQGDEPALLRAKKELGDGTESGWTLFFIPQAGIRTRSSRGHCQTMGYL
jgi:mediator of RNA polymerase II transcription subunit 18